MKLKKYLQPFISATFRDTFHLFVGNMGSSLLGIGFSIMAARALKPAEFGVLAGFMSFVAIVGSVGDLGLGASLFRFSSEAFSKGDKKTANQMLSLVFWLRLFSALILFAFIAIFLREFSISIFNYDDPWLMVVAGFAIAAYLLFDFLMHVLQAKKLFIANSFFLIISNLIRLGLLTFFFLSQNASLLVVALLFALSPFLTFLLALTYESIPFKVSENWKDKLKEVVPFAGWMGLNRVFASMGGRVDALLVLQLLLPAQAGLYSAAKQITFGIPLFIGSFATVLAPRYSSLSNKKLRIYFRKTIYLSIIMSFMLIIGLFIAPFFVYLFGEEYTDSLPILRWLIISYVPFVLATPAVNYIIYSLKKPVIITSISGFQLIVIIVANIWFVNSMGVYAPVAAVALSNIILLVVSYAFTAKELYINGQ